jgi:hypothetical protein
MAERADARLVRQAREMAVLLNTDRPAAARLFRALADRLYEEGRIRCGNCGENYNDFDPGADDKHGYNKCGTVRASIQHAPNSEGRTRNLRRALPTDYLCLAVSPDGFICNEDPQHDGDHVARAGFAGSERVEVDRWKNDKEPTLRRQDPKSEGR